MAGMLPGVELARRRTASHHRISPRCPSLHQRLEPSRAMGETALKARRGLEEKLGLRAPRSGELLNGDTVSNDIYYMNKTKVQAAKLLKNWLPKLNQRK